MTKIIPKLNLNKTPQHVDNGALIFAKDIMLNKDDTLSRDEVLISLLNSNNIAGVISSNNEFYVFSFNKSGETITNSYIRKYVEEDGVPNQTPITIHSAWKYSGGKIDGKVIKGLNGDTILVVNEYDAPVDVPLKIININECSSTDDESKYTQIPNVPIVNLNKISTYSQKIPKGVYQFFIRFEISKDFYTNWMPCSKELYSYNTVYKKIVQGTIKYVDENADSDFSFVFTSTALSNQQNIINKYKRFQLGFILSTNDANVCRTWKHFNVSYLTSGSLIYFSYNENDIKEYDIDEMTKYTFGLYNVKNVTSFKNKLYISNYKETNFNPNFNVASHGNVEYIIKQIAAHTESLDNPYLSIQNGQSYETYSLSKDDELANGGFNKIGNSYVSSWFNVDMGEIYSDGNGFTSISSGPLIATPGDDFGTDFDSNGLTSYDVPSDTNYEDAIGSAPTCDYIEIAYTANGVTNYAFITSDSQGNSFNFDDVDDEEIDYPYYVNNKINSLLQGYKYLCVTQDKQIKFINSTGIYDITSIKYYGMSKEENILGSGEIYPYFFMVDIQLYLTSVVSIVTQRTIPEYKGQTLLPRTGYDFYVHYVKQNGEITNGYKLTNLSSNITNWFDKNVNVCVPKFTNITIPNGYKCAFISYAKVNNKYTDVHNSGVSIVGKDGTTYYLYDCVEADAALSTKWDKIKLYSGSDNLIKDSNAFYRPSSFYDDNLPKLFGATGKIVSTVNITNPYILDEFAINDESVELIYCTPYFVSSEYNEYERMNLRGFICDVYKPQNISEYNDNYENKEDEVKVSNDPTKVIDELTYYYTGTDIYTKSENGDLNQYKDRKDIGESVPIKVISEYNLDCLSIANQFIDITRPYYVKDISEGTTVTTTDATYEYYGGTPNASNWASNCEGKYIIIPDCLCTEAMISNANVVGETVRNLKLNPLSKYLNHTTDNSKRLLFFKTGAITETLSTLRSNSSNYKGNSDIVTYDMDVEYCQKLLSWADLNDALQAGDLQLIDSSDVGSTICRVYKYGPVSEYKKGGVKSITLVTQTKTTNKYEDRIVESSIKTSTTYKFNSQRVYADGYNGIVPQADNIETDDHTYWRTDDFGLIWYGGKGEPTIVKEPSIDVSENNGEINAYQQYSYIESLNLNSLYKLPSMYINITRKTYSKADISNNIVQFDNTIRSSDTYTDESKKFIFTFNANSYYNVDCSKGKIVNLIAIGNYILVHTEDSLFNFSGSNSLQTQNGEAKLAESNVFETGITEVVGSQYGYCGLAEKNHACATQSGYIFYDASVRKIYAYTGQGQINVISDPIDKLMKYNKIIDVNFGNDYYNDRILICIKYNVNNDVKFITLSFNYRVNSLVSAHNFWFDKSFNTKTNVYYMSRQGAISGAFSALAYSDAQPLNWSGINDIDDENFYTNSNITDILPRLKVNNKLASVIDIIHNEEYEKVKKLEHINWICNGIYSFDDSSDLMAEESFELSENSNNQYIEKVSKYCGDKVKIYTDSAETDYVDIYHNNDINSDYSHPRFNTGIWSFNYFRNIRNNNNSNISDNLSVIYGKYIVVRFMLDRVNHDFKFENLFIKTGNL